MNFISFEGQRWASSLMISAIWDQMHTKGEFVLLSIVLYLEWYFLLSTVEVKIWSNPPIIRLCFGPHQNRAILLVEGHFWPLPFLEFKNYFFVKSKLKVLEYRGDTMDGKKLSLQKKNNKHFCLEKLGLIGY